MMSGVSLIAGTYGTYPYKILRIYVLMKELSIIVVSSFVVLP